MGLLDTLTGRREDRPATNKPAASEDEQAVRRYLYMLRTAPPETIEQAHEEAFARLSPEQRRQVLQQLRAAAPQGEQGGEDPRSLARMATRAEVRQPGTLERVLGGGVGGGMGGGFIGGLLPALAGSFIGTALAQHFLGSVGHEAAGLGGHEAAGLADEGQGDGDRDADLAGDDGDDASFDYDDGSLMDGGGDLEI